MDETGFHRIVGRKSIDMIESGGYRGARNLPYDPGVVSTG